MMDSSVLKLAYIVPGDDFTQAGLASSQLKSKLKMLGVPPAVIRRTAITVYEGEINMVIHAGGGVITAEITPELITVTLADNGPGIPDVARAMTEGYSTADESVRSLGFGAGMGLPNMKKYADEMTIETALGSGTTVTVRIYIK